MFWFVWNVLFQIYEHLGSKEVDDQLAVVKYLKENLLFIDEKRIAIWGWSYGGYVTTMALARDAENIFSCGVAVAPVTRWEHYGKKIFIWDFESF